MANDKLLTIAMEALTEIAVSRCCNSIAVASKAISDIEAIKIPLTKQCPHRSDINCLADESCDGCAHVKT